ncbi:carbohydrate ABC transporter permease [Actinopolymorpha alba]|uniref:carbohydrate ABC transporter permease n=1 Tax=Actinopolymorpha alba TaxID=533267 RepID=UPI0003747126|nr:carbohydrate ABC transporter permease [Actinopolymorpha alba]
MATARTNVRHAGARQRTSSRLVPSPRRLLLHTALAWGAALMVYPLLWLVSSSVKPDTEIFTQLGLWPRTFDLANYSEGWSGASQSFTVFFTNSLVITVGCVIGNILACSAAAYAFARIEFRFKKLWFAVMLSTLMLPHHVTLIPQYVLFFNLGWVNTYLPLIVPKFLATDAFFIFLMVQFIRTIPRELDDAAAVDGCGPFRFYLRIVLPLLRPALVTTAIFTFIWTYGDFLSQLIYLTEPGLYTVPLGLRMFLDSLGGSAWGPMFAMSVVSLIPTFLVFLFFQRKIVEGISTTGIRG